ncbi:MAG: amino acid adenylation domain-containing protein, partial [Halanaerobiales bacterium]|nr:amino acid adenylation domain-containing protein [Halanaerobiales bacterium]
ISAYEDTSAGEDEINLNFEYCTKLFKRETVERLTSHFRNILKAVTANADIKISDIEMLNKEEKDQILCDFNSTYVDYPRDKTIHNLFEEKVKNIPDNTAVASRRRAGEMKLTYKELNEKANQLARTLRENGVNADSIVGISVNRSFEMMIGILGILKAGGAYLPINPDYPEERFGYMLKDSGADILLTHEYLVNEVPFRGQIIALEDEQIYHKASSNLEPIKNSQGLAYIIYTSGSTGKPKGVMVSHKALNNFLCNIYSSFGENVGIKDNCLSLTNISFDVSICEIFMPLVFGATLVLYNNEMILDIHNLVRTIADKEITFAYIPPTILKEVYERLSNEEVKLNKMLVGVEPIKDYVLEDYLKLNENMQIINGYGPTEATICTTFYKYGQTAPVGRNVPIGKPLANTQIYILDQYSNLVPKGVVGELCISGDGLAEGYINREDLTAEKFVPNPFIAGMKMYKTGDMARLLTDGNIEFLGRIDHQVKIRGYRIELGEIESQLLNYNPIKEAIVVDQEDKNGSKYLCAYVVSEKEVKVGDFTPKELREFLLISLPEYMIPSYFVQLDQMPLTANGKIDRKALPELEGKIVVGTEYEAPRNATEEKLVDIWGEVLGAVLGIKKVGINDNFFELGGHSLKATILVAKMHKALNVEVPLNEIFKRPTIKGISEYIKNATKTAYIAIEKVESAGYYEVSSAQKRMYMLQQFDLSSTNYNMPGVLEVEGILNIERVEKAFYELIRRHESIRTSFETIEDKVIQKVNSYTHVEAKFKVDYLNKTDKAIEEVLNEFVTSFDLTKAPLFRVGVMKLQEDKHILLFDMHHIISDGISMGIFINEFAKFYEGKELDKLRIQYKDFAKWQNNLLRSDIMKKQEEYWISRFSNPIQNDGQVPVLNMPTDYPRPTIQRFAGDSISFKLDKNLTQDLKRIAKETGSTMYMVLLSGVNILLSKYSGQEDIIVGSPIAGRPHADLAKIIGMFVNTLAMRNNPDGNKTYEEFLKEVKENSLKAYENQDYQFEELVEQLDLSRDMSRNPLFDVMFTMQNFNNGELKIENLEFKPFNYDQKISKFDLTIAASEGVSTDEAEEIILNFEYCTKLFKRETIERMKAHLTNIFKIVTVNTEVKLSEIDVLTKEERDMILYDINNTYTDYPRNKTLQDLFEEHVERTPNHIAVVFKEKNLTYKELNERSNSLANILRVNGVKEDTVIGIIAKKSLEVIVGVMAILKAGGAYLPIDLEYPENRINYMLEDSSVKILLTLGDLRKDIDFNGNTIDVLDETLYSGKQNNLENINTPESLAYVIYTSGSTGKPKGVMIEHRNVARLIKSTNYVQFADGDKMLQTGTLAFDASIFEVWGALLNGLELHLASKDLILKTEAMEKYLVDNQISTVLFTTPLFNLMAEEKVEMFKPLKYLFIGGDVISPKHVNKVKKVCNLNIVNLYGPTENTTVSTYFAVDQEDASNIPIGKPISNSTTYILDQYNNLSPIGVHGELHVGGDGLARGYVNNSELTAEKFIENPFIPGDKIYRTGDLVRLLSDGNIEFLGRIDNQVKIRGFRIEIGEIENSILNYDGIKEAIVIDQKDKNGNKYLSAYVVANQEISVEDLRKNLSNSLPDYMIPAHFMQLERMPLTKNGKVDRKALPEPEGNILTGVEYVAPRNEVEEKVALIWSEVLGVEKVGINDSFFSLGGDSIKSIQVASRLNNYGLKLEINDLFKHRCISELSSYIKNTNSTAEQGIVEGEVKLTPIQVWFFEQKFTDMHHFNHSVMLHNREGFDNDALRKAFTKIVEHHDALRMVYKFEENSVKQYNRGSSDNMFDLQIFDLVEESNYMLRIEEEANKIQSSIDLETGPLIKLGVFKTEEGDHLLIVIHHLVVDGVSWRIIFEDLATAYSQAQEGKEIKLPRKTQSFKEWAEKLLTFANSKEILEQMGYWERLEQIEVKPLPREREIQSNKRKDTKILPMVLEVEDTEKLLKHVNQAYNTEINDILLVALGLAVKDWTGEDVIAISLEGHGRENIIEDVNITRTVGWFTSQYPVIFDMSSSEDISHIIKAVKEELRRIPDKGIGYGILRYLTQKSNQKHKLSMHPEISLNYLGQFDMDVNTGIFNISNASTGLAMSSEFERNHAIDVNGMIVGGSLRLDFSYNMHEFSHDTVQHIVDSYSKNIKNIIDHCMQQQEIDMSKMKQFEKIYPLSPMQQGMLFHYLKDTKSIANFEQSELHLAGNLDIDLFEKSLNLLVQRYDILRTNFEYEKLQISRQVVYKNKNQKIYFEDLSMFEENEKLSYITKFKEIDLERGFDLAKDNLMRIAILKIDQENYKMIWSFHHIIMDGWCLGIIFKDLLMIYQALKVGKTANLSKAYPFSSYIDWLQNQDQEEAFEYWQNYLENYEQQALPLGYNINLRNREYAKNEHVFKFDGGLARSMKNIAKNCDITLNTLIQALWGILLQKYNNTDDVVFGAVVSGRPPEIQGIEQIVGLFINTIPVRVRYKKGESFAEVVKHLQEGVVLSRKYEYSSLAEIQSNTALKQNLVNNIVVFENYPVDKEMKNLGIENIGFEMKSLESSEQTNYDFNIILSPDGDGLVTKFSYNTFAYDAIFIKRMEEHFKNAIKAVVENPDICVEDIEILSHEEKDQILCDFNNTYADYPRDKTIHKLFEEQVEKTSENLAVVSRTCEEEKQLTYRELNEKANSLANILRENGVKENILVGIIAEKSLEMIVGVMAILKAGGAYLPIDPEYPQDRIKFMLEDCSVDILLKQGELEQNIEHNCNVIDILDETLYQINKENLQNINTPRSLAYVIYTSGSTGKPKGVMVEHKNIVRLVKNPNYIEFEPGDKILQTGTLAFDASTFEIWGALLNGLELHLGSKDLILRPEEMAKYLVNNQISSLFLTTALFNVMSEEKPDMFETLKFLLTGGEAASFKHFNQVRRECKDLKIANIYGPTENTTFSTVFFMNEECSGNIPIGKLINNTTGYVVDKNNKLSAIGVCGELCLGGDGLAQGYLNNPELTAEKFIQNPFVDNPFGIILGERLYRTGDLVRWLPDGNIEFLGRIDHQVKIRGFRIELGEIENSLLNYEDIKETIVIDRKDEKGNKYLCAYVVSDQEVTVGDFTPKELREFLLKNLPEYMIPSYFVQLDKMPLTANGKINREALPEPEGNVIVGTEYEAPQNKIEKNLVEIWKDVLGIEKVGINDNFFELGGHSLKATVLISKIHKKLNVEIPLRQVFISPTIKELSNFIIKADESTYLVIEPIEEIREYYPISLAQKRLYMVNQLNVDDLSYNMPAMYIIEGNLELDRLEVAFKNLINRHESLRTSFKTMNGEPVQIIHEDVNFEIKYSDLTDCAMDEIKATTRINSFMRPFDLEIAPLLRVEVVQFNEEYLLMLDLHHIIADGSAMNILIAEFVKLYQGIELSKLKLQYKDFAVWQSRLFEENVMAKQEDYWLNNLKDLQYTELPAKTAGSIKSNVGAQKQFDIGAELVEKIDEFCAKHNVTKFMFMLAVFKIAIFRKIDQKDLSIGIPIAGRNKSELQDLIGLFLNLLIIRSEIRDEMSFNEYLYQIKEVTTGAFENQDYPFDMLDLKNREVNNYQGASLFSILFNYLPYFGDDGQTLTEFTIRPYSVEKVEAKYDLTLYVSERQEDIHLSLVYKRDKYEDYIIEAIPVEIEKIINIVLENEESVITQIVLTDSNSLMEDFDDLFSDDNFDEFDF